MLHFSPHFFFFWVGNISKYYNYLKKCVAIFDSHFLLFLHWRINSFHGYILYLLLHSFSAMEQNGYMSLSHGVFFNHFRYFTAFHAHRKGSGPKIVQIYANSYALSATVRDCLQFFCHSLMKRLNRLSIRLLKFRKNICFWDI